jgi:hypothetical protein
MFCSQLDFYLAVKVEPIPGVRFNATGSQALLTLQINPQGLQDIRPSALMVIPGLLIVL